MGKKILYFPCLIESPRLAALLLRIALIIPLNKAKSRRSRVLTYEMSEAVSYSHSGGAKEADERAVRVNGY